MMMAGLNTRDSAVVDTATSTRHVRSVMAGSAMRFDCAEPCSDSRLPNAQRPTPNATAPNAGRTAAPTQRHTHTRQPVSGE